MWSWLGRCCWFLAKFRADASANAEVAEAAFQDINHKRNVSGAGINRAERVMSCGDEGHILFSDHAADALRHLSAWRDKIHEVGECQTKDGWIRVWNLVDGPIGNPAVPRKSRRHARRGQK
jgi:class 3 adenylate cyclase